MSIFINGVDAKIYGSRGQQRTIILSLKISQLQLWNEELNEYPILLMDDVFFELDDARRRALFNKVGGLVQTFITSTERENFYSHSDITKIYNVSKGKIII